MRTWRARWNRPSSSAPPSTSPPRSAARDCIDLRATGTVIKFDGFLTLYQEGQDDEPDDDDEGKRLPAMSAGEALAEARDRRRPSTSPSRRRATRKPRWSSAWRSSASAGPRPMRRSCRCSRTAAMCGSTRSASSPRTRAACVDRVPGELLRPLCRIRLHRRPRRAARPHLQQRDRLERRAARLLARLHRRGRRHQGAARRAGASTRSTRCWRRTSSRRARTAPIRATARPAAPAGCRSSSASSAPSSAARTIRSAATPASSPATAPTARPTAA